MLQRAEGAGVQVGDQVFLVVVVLKREPRTVEEAGGVIETLLEKLAPAHQPKLPIRREIRAEERALGDDEVGRRDRVKFVCQGGLEPAHLEHQAVVESVIDEGVEEVERPEAAIDRGVKLDGPGHPAAEIPALAGDRESAVDGVLASLGIASEVDLREVVELELKLVVLATDLEPRAKLDATGTPTLRRPFRPRRVAGVVTRARSPFARSVSARLTVRAEVAPGRRQRRRLRRCRDVDLLEQIFITLGEALVLLGVRLLHRLVTRFETPEPFFQLFFARNRRDWRRRSRGRVSRGDRERGKAMQDDREPKGSCQPIVQKRSARIFPLPSKIIGSKDSRV